MIKQIIKQIKHPYVTFWDWRLHLPAPSPTTASTTILNVALLKPCAKSSGLLTEKPLELCFNKGIRVFIKAELFSVPL